MKKSEFNALVQALFTANGQAGSGNVAQRLNEANMDPLALRPYIDEDDCAYVTLRSNSAESGFETRMVTNATLRKDEWIVFDNALLPVARRRMIGIQDLQSRGLTYGREIGLSATVLEYQDVTEMNDAVLSMNPRRRTDSDRQEFSSKYLPLPIIHRDWDLDIRTLNMSRRTGRPLDTAMVGAAGRKVAEMAENILFNGSGNFAFGGGTIYGYTDFPGRITKTLSAAWDGTATGEQILGDVLDMIDKAAAKNHYGPFVLYIPTGYQKGMGEDFKAGSDKSVRSRLLELEEIEDIKVAPFLASGNVCLVEMDENTIRLVDPVPLTNIEWSSEGGMVTDYKTMAIMVPQLRADSEGNCGLVHGTP